MREFTVQLPPKFEYKGTTQEERDRELEEYLVNVSRVLEDTILKLFRALVGSVDSPTAGNLPELDEDGYIVDSGVAVADVAVDSDVLWEVDGGDTEMKTADDIDMQNMQVKGMCLENRTDDTGCTQTGRIWIRTDL